MMNAVSFFGWIKIKSSNLSKYRKKVIYDMLCNIVIHKGVLNTLKNTTFENRYRIVLE